MGLPIGSFLYFLAAGRKKAKRKTHTRKMPKAFLVNEMSNGREMLPSAFTSTSLPGYLSALMGSMKKLAPLWLKVSPSFSSQTCFDEKQCQPPPSLHLTMTGSHTQTGCSWISVMWKQYESPVCPKMNDLASNFSAFFSAGAGLSSVGAAGMLSWAKVQAGISRAAKTKKSVI